LPTTAAILATGGLWAVRKWSRAPLAGWLYYCGTLFPVLGFVNVHYFVYSYVADHLQYLAALGIIVPVTSGVAHALSRWTLRARPLAGAIGFTLLVTLGVLTWRQSHKFAGPEVFYHSILARNPSCWMAHNNLASEMILNGDYEGAIEHGEAAIRLWPRYPGALCNLGVALMHSGRLSEAVQALQAALTLDPESPVNHYNLGLALTQLHREPEAIASFHRALRLRPSYAAARNGLGAALYGNGQIADAVEQFRLALQNEPDNQGARSNLGLLLHATGEVAEAIPFLKTAAEKQPDRLDLHYTLADSFRRMARLGEAVEQYNAVVALQAQSVAAYAGLAESLALLGRSNEAIATAEKGIDVGRATGQQAAAEQLQTWLENYRIQSQPAKVPSLP
jgi:tetratricopeptide (TPR) repeat protein